MVNYILARHADAVTCYREAIGYYDALFGRDSSEAAYLVSIMWISLQQLGDLAGAIKELKICCRNLREVK